QLHGRQESCRRCDDRRAPESARPRRFRRRSARARSRAHLRFLRHPAVLSSCPVGSALDHGRTTGDDLALRLSSRNLVARAEGTVKRCSRVTWQRPARQTHRVPDYGFCLRADNGKSATECPERPKNIGASWQTASRACPERGSVWEARWRVLASGGSRDPLAQKFRRGGRGWGGAWYAARVGPAGLSAM